ncbi:MAG: glycosyltransferase family 9 protein [Candidatus Omnitrophota bacterium]
MKILFINPFGIGDVLFTTALINNIKQSMPECSISYWCNERVSEIFKSDPRIDKVFALSRGDLKKIFQYSIFQGFKRFFSLLRGIKKERFEVAFDFSLDHRYGIIIKLLGIKKRIGLNYKNRGRFLTDKINIDGYNGKHVIEYYLDLLRFISIKPQTKGMETFVSQESITKCRNMLNRFGIGDKDLVVGIAAGAGASWGKNASLKHWPAIKYAQLADKIIEDFKAKIILLGDNTEKPISEAIMASMKNKTIDFTGKTNLPELTAVINNLNLLITNDGGPLHIAVSRGIKTISIFGPVDESVYGPYPPSEKHIVIKTDLACRPCYKKFKMGICDKDKKCINSIETNEVLQAVKELCKV